MKTFSLDQLAAGAYGRMEYNDRKPVIGITADSAGIDYTLRNAYCRQVVAAGAVPVIIPPVTDAAVINETLERIDALILSGGGDHNQLWQGEQPIAELHSINAERDSAELLIARMAYNRRMPILGICRGMQTLTIALGGRVKQDIGRSMKHSQDADRSEPTHTVTIMPSTTLYKLYADGQAAKADDEPGITIPVNSFHHQAVNTLGTHLVMSAIAPDGITEAVESIDIQAAIGVQWHPEWLGEDGLPLFIWLKENAMLYRKAQKLHDRIPLVDSHCDTPMFFHQGVDFLQRDERILVDLHKMHEGRLDATSMVCYLPQPYADGNGASEDRKGKPFSELVHYPIESPREYTDFIFDEIEKIVARAPHHLAFARNAAELCSNKSAGLKSIMLGIENGLAIEDNIDNLDHFASRGIVYMTLCHNGDNLICDSARTGNTHGGVSAYGKEVIRHMNRLGIMVDLSHAAESSFYDAQETSQTPIVCSHSNCRSLCDHPRNLTDEQMRALAKAGGVMQVTLYGGFLRTDGEATLNDVMAHLEHAISIMGIDHVGIGTDFDGDGGVRGMGDASACINLTMELMRRGYSDNDISKIWGGNWLRVMTQVQSMRSA